jgi:outer membrane protein OmpA-like peptidoglycan-associated protein
MKGTLLVMTAAVITAQTMSAQTVAESKTTDNWYVGVNTGMNFKTTHTAVLSNLNPSLGLRVGRNFTPVFGMAMEGETYMNNRGSNYRPLGTFIKGLNLSMLATTNFSNWIGGYKGEPRRFEVVGVYGLGWGHIFSNSSATVPDRNFLTSKIGVNFVMNIGESKAWQIYWEPNITYALNVGGASTQFNINNSAIGILTGVVYKFGNSNGSHNFVIADIYDEAEIAVLNDRINALRAENAVMDDAVASRDRMIKDLRSQLANAKPETVIVNDIEEDVLQPVVIFRQGECMIDAAQYANISLIARYMQANDDVSVVVKGYASMEGSKDLNQKLSEKRAEAVKNALVKRYNISADRLVTEGHGATDQMFTEPELNRVVVFAGE